MVDHFPPAGLYSECGSLASASSLACWWGSCWASCWTSSTSTSSFGWPLCVSVLLLCTWRGALGRVHEQAWVGRDREVQELQAAVSRLSLRVEELQGRVEALEGQEAAESGSWEEVPAACAATEAAEEAEGGVWSRVDRLRLAERIGGFIRRSLQGRHRGTGRDRFPLRSRIYVVARDIKGRTYDPVVVDSRFSAMRAPRLGIPFLSGSLLSGRRGQRCRQRGSLGPMPPAASEEVGPRARLEPGFVVRDGVVNPDYPLSFLEFDFEGAQDLCGSFGV